MSVSKSDVKAAFDQLQEFSGQKNKFIALNDGADAIIDKLNEFLEAATEQVDKDHAEEAIEAISNVKEADIAAVKTLQDEARGKVASKSRDRDYERQVSTAIDALRSAISYFL